MPRNVEASRNQIPEIEGLRAIAVLLVVAYHVDLISFGWVGVWVFFPISGFVITLSLQKRDASGLAGLWAFWRRRAARLLPLFLLVVGLGVGVSLAGWLLTGRQPRELEHVPWLLGLAYNFYRMTPGYEATTWFGHLWSLAVEEQFYLLFPLAFLLMARQHVRVLLTAWLVLAPLIRLGLWALLTHHGWSPAAIGNAVYQFSPGHFDAFTIGCLAAMDRTADKPQRPWMKAALAACLVAVIVEGALAASPSDPVGGLVAAFAVNTQGPVNQIAVYALLTAIIGLVLAGVGRDARWQKVLRSPVLVGLGGLSYGIYMIHMPLRALYQHAPLPEWVGKVVYLVVLIPVAWACRRWFERPAEAWIMGQSSAMADIMRPKSGSPARKARRLEKNSPASSQVS